MPGSKVLGHKSLQEGGSGGKPLLTRAWLQKPLT